MDRNEFTKKMLSKDIYITQKEILHIINESICNTPKMLKYIIAIEELSELQKEISKHARGEHNWMAIVEEMADVYIMLETIKHIVDIPATAVEKAINIKLAQL